MNWENSKDVCGAMIGIDTKVGMFYLSCNDALNNNVWEILIVLTSNNGCSLDKRNCHYPLRGGKNGFHEGVQRVLAIAAVGNISDRTNMGSIGTFRITNANTSSSRINASLSNRIITL